MRKEELRPCVIEIKEETEIVRNANDGKFIERVISPEEMHNGYFHAWGT